MEHILKRPDGCNIFYTVDDYSDPWKKTETVLFVHGLAESGEAWRAWVPHFARHYRVVRIDLRGFGRSTAMLAEHEWSMDELLDDIEALIHHIGCTRVHLIGAKSGGSMALAMAANRPQLVQTLIGVTPPILPAAGVDDWVKHINSKGVVDWAAHTMQGRLGTQASKAEVDWWIHNLQGKTPLSTLQGYLRWVPKLDIRDHGAAAGGRLQHRPDSGATQSRSVPLALSRDRFEAGDTPWQRRARGLFARRQSIDHRCARHATEGLGRCDPKTTWRASGQFAHGGNGILAKRRHVRHCARRRQHPALGCVEASQSWHPRQI